ncbi:MAG: lycopene cyclase domain-containing protein [Patescibacteria group bacterium]|nr:lycopene cyclase domain-containing protein [Patescibacteria group bacterium]
MIQYGYFIFSLFFLLVWLLIFLRARQWRRPMLILSLITMLFGPLSEFWYFKDYWQPDFILSFPIGGLEDLIFGFSIGGIGAFVYESLFLKHLCSCQAKKYRYERFLLFFVLVEGVSMLIFNNLFKVNSIFASALGMIIVAAIMLYLRRDMIINALASGLLVALIMFIIYIMPQILFPQAHQFLPRYWLLYNQPTGRLILGHIPVTEMIWGFSWGLVWGPAYEFLTGAREIKLKRSLS